MATGTHFPLCWDCQVAETFRASARPRRAYNCSAVCRWLAPGGPADETLRCLEPDEDLTSFQKKREHGPNREPVDRFTLLDRGARCRSERFSMRGAAVPP